MAASKRQMNWVAVGFTPTSGSLITFSGVTNCKFDPGGKLIDFSGDNDKYPTTIVNPMSSPSATVTSADIATMMGLAVGTTGSLTATLKDAKGASGGDIIYVMANAVVENTPVGATHAQFGDGTISFRAFSADGSTSPLGFTRA